MLSGLPKFAIAFFLLCACSFAVEPHAGWQTWALRSDGSWTCYPSTDGVYAFDSVWLYLGDEDCQIWGFDELQSWLEEIYGGDYLAAYLAVDGTCDGRPDYLLFSQGRDPGSPSVPVSGTTTTCGEVLPGPDPDPEGEVIESSYLTNLLLCLLLGVQLFNVAIRKSYL